MTQFEHYDDGEIGPPPPPLLTRGEFGFIVLIFLLMIAGCTLTLG